MTVKTKAQLATDLSTNLANNTSGAITPQVLRTHLTDMTDSLRSDTFVWLDSGSFVPPASGLWPGRVKSTVIAGGAAGNLTVTGIATTDRLHSVVRLDRQSVAAITGGEVPTEAEHNAALTAIAAITQSDLTSEFTISAANTINNTGGTATTGDVLFVQYSGGYDLAGMAFDGTIDEKTGVSLVVPASWASVDIYMLGLAADFSNATVRFYHSDDTGTAVDIAITGGGTGLIANDLAFTSVSSGPGSFPLQFKNFSFVRHASNAGDTYNGIDFCVLGLILAPGS